MHWTVHQDFHNVDPDSKGLTCPKPDLTYGFPVFTSRDKLPPGFADEACGTSFQHSKLRRLWQNSKCSISPVPSKSLLNAEENDRAVLNLTCFPWAIVEAKHGMVNGNTKDFCYRQAANATSVALSMFSTIFRTANGAIADDLPPVIAFTCVGPAIRVWLTYDDGTSQDPRKFVSLP